MIEADERLEAEAAHQVLMSVSIHVISDLPCDGNQFIEYRYDIVNSSFPFTQLIASPDHGDPTHQLLASYMYSISVIPVVVRKNEIRR